MTDKFNANIVSLFLHRKLWIHPIEKSIYMFTGGNFDFILKKSNEYLLANIFHTKDTTEAIFYKVYDKLIDNKEIPFITIGKTEYEVVELAFGTSDDKLVLKTSENVELVFEPYLLNK